MRRAGEKKTLPQVFTAHHLKGSVGSPPPALRCVLTMKSDTLYKILHDLVTFFPVTNSWPGALLTNSFFVHKGCLTPAETELGFPLSTSFSGCRAAGTLRG